MRGADFLSSVAALPPPGHFRPYSGALLGYLFVSLAGHTCFCIFARLHVRENSLCLRVGPLNVLHSEFLCLPGQVRTASPAAAVRPSATPSSVPATWRCGSATPTCASPAGLRTTGTPRWCPVRTAASSVASRRCVVLPAPGPGRRVHTPPCSALPCPPAPAAGPLGRGRLGHLHQGVCAEERIHL